MGFRFIEREKQVKETNVHTYNVSMHFKRTSIYYVILALWIPNESIKANGKKLYMCVYVWYEWFELNSNDSFSRLTRNESIQQMQTHRIIATRCNKISSEERLGKSNEILLTMLSFYQFAYNLRSWNLIDVEQLCYLSISFNINLFEFSILWKMIVPPLTLYSFLHAVWTMQSLFGSHHNVDWGSHIFYFRIIKIMKNLTHWNVSIYC